MGGNAEIVDTDIVVEASGDGAAAVNLRPSQMLDRQTFVFSATLTVPDNVRRKLKKRQAQAFAGEDKKKAASGASAGTLAKSTLGDGNASPQIGGDDSPRGFVPFRSLQSYENLLSLQAGAQTR